MPSPNQINPLTGKRYGWEAEQAEVRQRDPKEIAQEIALLERQQAALLARDQFMDFVKFTMPDPDDPNDVRRSKYQNAKHHDGIASAIEQVEKGEIRFLILTCPPRHGKSELVSRRLPAWFIGRHPEQNVAVATYNDDFAMDFGKDVRGIMATPQYKQVFPNVKLQRGGAASDRLQTTKGGMLSFVGRKGGLTGRGAHCFPAGTLVETTEGPMPIEKLCVSPLSVKVVNYDRQTGQLTDGRVQAFASRQATRLLRITTTSGRVVDATPNHPFFTPRGYVEAHELAAGDRLLQLVRSGGAEDGVRDHQAREARVDGALLLQSLLGSVRERQPLWAAEMRRLWRRCAQGAAAWVAGEHLLLAGVPQGASRSEEGGFASDPTVADLPGVRDGISGRSGAGPASREEGHVADSVLRHGLQKSVTCPANAWEGKPWLSAWLLALASAAPLSAVLPRHETADTRARWPLLRALLGGRAPTRPPHRVGLAGQSLEESDQSVPKVSLRPSWRREVARHVAEDTVLRVDEVAVSNGYTTVYDIQVEGQHNFFANGVLVHNCMILDDLIKDDKEAQSLAIRNEAWNFFTKVAMTRRMGKKLVIMTFTRWHADDPIGRLTDPENEHYRLELAKKIKIINLPGIAEDDDPLGRKPGEPLWPDGPDQFDLDFLNEQRLLDPMGFEALYQQRPSMLDGDMFKRENLRFYKQEDLPEELRIYCASDHAVATGQRNDPTVLLKIGIDRYSNIYLMECFWQKVKSDVAVEAMLTMASGKHAPLIWWAEKGHISKAIGPFLNKRMLETDRYINIREVTPAADKATRAQSIAARVGMSKVWFPVDAPWTEKAINELMAFPNGTHDDFVDALAYIGLGLQSQFGASAPSQKKVEPKFGTAAWLKQNDDWRKTKEREKANGGF